MRPDYCPIANEPCQCVCLDGCRIKNNSRKPLTDEEIQAIWVEHGCDGEDAEDFAHAVIEAYEIKNGLKP